MYLAVTNWIHANRMSCLISYSSDLLGEGWPISLEVFAQLHVHCGFVQIQLGSQCLDQGSDSSVLEWDVNQLREQNQPWGCQ